MMVGKVEKDAVVVNDSVLVLSQEEIEELSDRVTEVLKRNEKVMGGYDRDGFENDRMYPAQ